MIFEVLGPVYKQFPEDIKRGGRMKEAVVVTRWILIYWLDIFLPFFLPLFFSLLALSRSRKQVKRLSANLVEAA